MFPQPARAQHLRRYLPCNFCTSKAKQAIEIRKLSRHKRLVVFHRIKLLRTEALAQDRS